MNRKTPPRRAAKRAKPKGPPAAGPLTGPTSAAPDIVAELEAEWFAATRAYWSARHDPSAFAAMRQVAQRYCAATGVPFEAPFWDVWQWQEVGDQGDLEIPVGFLEADPWYHRSGYQKADVIRRVTQRPIPEVYAERLRRVVLSIVDLRDGREFRAYCRLARSVDSPDLRQQLRARLDHPDRAIRRRARWVLEALPEGR